MSSTSGATRAQNQGEKHVHHGRTTAAWAGTTIAIIAFILAAIAMVPRPNWVLLGVAVALMLVAVIVTQVLRKLGHGAD